MVRYSFRGPRGHMEFHKATSSITPACHRLGEVRTERWQRSTGCCQEEHNPPRGFTVWLRRGSEGPTCPALRLLQQWSNSGEIRSDVGIVFLLLKAYFSPLSDSNSPVLSEGKRRRMAAACSRGVLRVGFILHWGRRQMWVQNLAMHLARPLRC